MLDVRHSVRRALLAAALLAGAAVAQEANPKVPTPATPPAGQPVVPQGRAAAVAAWFPVTEQRLETTPVSGEAVAVYAFSNPTDQTFEWKGISGSCTCTRGVIRLGDRHYELLSKTKQLVQVTGEPGAEQTQVVQSIQVPPKATGTVELHVDSHGAKGEKIVSMDIHTTDTSVHMFRLQLRLNVLEAIRLDPPIVDLGVVPGGVTREFSVKAIGIQTLRKDWKIRGASPFQKGTMATYERHEEGGQSYWLIKGTFRQEMVGDINMLLEFQTDVVEEPTIHVRLQGVVKPFVELKPGFFALGRVSRSAGTKTRMTFHAVDGRDLQVSAVRLEGLNLPEKFVTTHTSKDGKDLVLELEVAPDAPLGLIRGTVVVDIDYPDAPQHRILFNGFVR
jgi:hypothetical protein